MLTDPQYRIHESAVGAWQLANGVKAILTGIVLYFATVSFMGKLTLVQLILALIAVLLLATIYIVYVPVVRHRHWRYEVKEKQIELKYGIFIIRRILVPINRVQHVDTRQGPIYRWFSLASVTISSAATTHEIPALDENTAQQLRDQIAQAVQKSKEDV
ncbi:MAG: PH domain-containing protein [Bacteroidota bacterium]